MDTKQLIGLAALGIAGYLAYNYLKGSGNISPSFTAGGGGGGAPARDGSFLTDGSNTTLPISSTPSASIPSLGLGLPSIPKTATTFTSPFTQPGGLEFFSRTPIQGLVGTSPSPAPNFSSKTLGQIFIPPR